MLNFQSSYFYSRELNRTIYFVIHLLSNTLTLLNKVIIMWRASQLITKKESKEFFFHMYKLKFRTVDKTTTTEIETFNEHNNNLAIVADSFLKL